MADLSPRAQGRMTASERAAQAMVAEQVGCPPERALALNSGPEAVMQLHR
jgi:hypothetical protein